ncbi:UNVERIFIED_CONTAM: cation acetate symporter, partial [Bacillus sp. ATCC 13368]
SSIIVLVKFDFRVIEMFRQMKTATTLGGYFLNPVNKFKAPLVTLSVILALVLGTAGPPHSLIRFFTLNAALYARKSAVYGTW